jgi:putative ABC transport system permease protein
MSLFKRIGSLLRNRRLDQDLDDELRSHLEMSAADKVESGMTEERAQREAFMRLGNRQASKENTRSVYMIAWIESVLQDLRYGWRNLRRSPGFSIVAMATVALSIGITTAVFTIVNSVLLRPLPYPDSKRLISVATLDPRSHEPVTPGPDFVAWQQENTTLSSIAAYTSDDFNFSGAGEPARIPAAEVTASFFSTLGIQPELGRGFSSAEEQPNGEHVAVLSNQFWRERFSADAKVLGQKINLEGQLYVVVGVLPPQFRFPDNGVQPSVLLPLQYPLGALDRILIVNAVGRLKDGVTQQQASADLDRISNAMLLRYPVKMQGFFKGRSMQITNLHTLLVGDVRTPLLVIMCAVGFLLLIGCLNITSLQLARAVERTSEMEMRSALGAKRGRLTRQLLTENALLYGVGALLGISMALAAVQFVRSTAANIFPSAITISADSRALAFAVVVTLLSAMLFGLIPALSLNKTRIVRQPGAGRLTTGNSYRRLRKLLLVSEVSLALVLMSGAGLMVQSFDRLMRVNAGFNPSHLLTAHVSLSETEFPKAEQQVAFFDTLCQRLKALPGVESAALTSAVPLQADSSFNVGVRIEGEPIRPVEIAPFASMTSVSPDYFRTLQAPIIAGRGFTDSDSAASIPVAIVNQAFVRKFLHGADPLTKRILGRDSTQSVTIIGIAADIHHSGLDQDVTPQIYRPYNQPAMPLAFRMAVLLRSRIDPGELAGQVRREVSALHGGQPVFDVATMDQLLRASTMQRRLTLALLGLFAALALLLAAIGIYGVMSYSVAQRAHEIGIRIAVGCSPGRVLRLILGETAWVMIVGMVVGLAAALWLTRFIASLLYQTQPYDVVSMLSASALLVAVGLLAGTVPAYHASRVDPVIALRAE